MCTSPKKASRPAARYLTADATTYARITGAENKGIGLTVFYSIYCKLDDVAQGAPRTATLEEFRHLFPPSPTYPERMTNSDNEEDSDEEDQINLERGTRARRPISTRRASSSPRKEQAKGGMPSSRCSRSRTPSRV